jgi:hypothetical protein
MVRILGGADRATSRSHRRPLDSATEPRQADHSRMFPAMAARDAVLCLESSNCSNVPLAGSNRLPAQQHPSGRPTAAQEDWGSGTPTRGTAGALAQGTALHAGARIPDEISVYVATRAWLGLAQMRWSAQRAPTWFRRDHMTGHQSRGSSHSRWSIQTAVGVQLERTLPSAKSNASSTLSLLPSA